MNQYFFDLADGVCYLLVHVKMSPEHEIVK